MSRWVRRVYPTKPGPSGVLGGLVLAGVLRPRDRVLEVGCGTGTDALAMAAWGMRVTAIDVSARAIAVARRRAKRQRRLRFEVCDVAEVPQRFRRGAFDAAVDSMCWNNLERGAEEGYARAMAWAVRPGGCLVVQARVSRRSFEAQEGLWLEEALSGDFELEGPVHVALPDGAEPAARVAAYLGWRKGK